MMGKKNWIYIKRGLNTDPKHRLKMGISIWCFQHIVDGADFESGIFYDWKDEDEASDMGMPWRTLRDWRQKLEREEYILCIQKQHSLDIKIYNWVNPREYSGKVMNPRPEMNNAEFEGDNKSAPSDFQGDTQESRNLVTPTSDSRLINQESFNDNDDELTKRTALFVKLYEQNFGPLTPILADYIKSAVVDYPKIEWYEPAFLVAVENNVRKLSYLRSILQGWKENYFGWKPEYKKNGANHGNTSTNSRRATPGNTGGNGRGGQGGEANHPTRNGLSAEAQKSADRINAKRAEKRRQALLSDV